METGTLYLVATPIGNLGDITLRALEVLRQVDVVAAEDTRRTLKLLNHYSLKKKLVSYHEHSGKEKAEELLALLQKGQNVALVSDAGTPLISDPGAPLVALAAAEGIPMTVLPGACAAVCALTLSALPSGKFIFEGFLPRDKTRKAALDRVCKHEYATVLYESPHQLVKTLGELAEQAGERRIAICRELTKLHEEVERTTVAEAFAARQDCNIRGEHVLVLEGAPVKQAEVSDEAIALELRQRIADGMTNKNAVSDTALALQISKNRVYRILLTLEL